MIEKGCYQVTWYPV